jgi:multidrug transporter EmrE-like cation transporter
MYKFGISEIVIIIALVSTETMAQSCLNNGVNGKFKQVPKNISVILGMILYSVVAFIYYRLLTSLSTDGEAGNALNTANSIWNAGIQISIALVSWLVFKEKMTLMNWIGTVLMAMGLLMVI